MLSFYLGAYYGFVLGFLGAVAWRHWETLYEPRAYIHEEPDQAYYWTPEWQKAEKESLAELEAGRGVTFDSANDAIRWLRDGGP